jgi:hypothetical protein
MKKNFTNRIGVFLLLLVSTVFNTLSADQPIAPPPAPGTGGGGTGGPGIAASPIDMYQVLLLIAAVFLIAYFYKKTKLITN